VARNYETYQLLAFNNSIPNELMITMRDWVVKEIPDWSDEDRISPTDDLGYAELADIVTVDQAFNAIKECIWMTTQMETEKKTEEAKKKFYKDAGGRVGRGVYRYALKGYYLLETA